MEAAQLPEGPLEFQYDRAQDFLAFEAARKEEAEQQGAEETTQRGLALISRDEEARAQGVESIRNTTQKILFRVSRAEEAQAEKLEAEASGVKPDGMDPKEGLDQVALAEEQKLTAEELDAKRAKEQKQK